MNKEITVTPEDAGVRIDAFLAGALSMSRNAVQRAIVGGEITFATGKVIQKSYVTASGDLFRCALAEPEEIPMVAQDIPLDVVFEDDALIVVNKPRGMVVHPAPGHPDGTLVNALLFHCADSLSGIGGAKRPGIIHRLDKDTSGLLIVAKTDASHQALSDQLRVRSLTRIYEAVAIGRVGQDAGTVDAPIGRHSADRKRMSTSAAVMRDAVTHYTVIARYNGYTRIRCQLETGRTHQIRVHMASIGHPILGDLVYGRRRAERGLSGQCLHAARIAFDHPVTGQRMEYTSPLPPYFETVLGKLGEAELV